MGRGRVLDLIWFNKLFLNSFPANQKILRDEKQVTLLEAAADLILKR